MNRKHFLLLILILIVTVLNFIFNAIRTVYLIAIGQ